VIWRGSSERERGSASLWVLVCAVLVLVVGSVGTLRTLAVLARHRAESAADLVALAAAARIGVGTDYCAAAGRIAEANALQLVACRLALDTGERSGSVTVQVRVRVALPIVGGQDVVASARAGRLPASLPPSHPGGAAISWLSSVANVR
jgi:secretion/DNA translocation related TadE-like protein